VYLPQYTIAYLTPFLHAQAQFHFEVFTKEVTQVTNSKNITFFPISNNVFTSSLTFGPGTFMLFANINVTGGTTTACVFSISAISAVQDQTSAVQVTSGTPVSSQVSRVVNVTSSTPYYLVATITYTGAPTINSTNTKFYAVRIA
jgi:hypothetical protein